MICPYCQKEMKQGYLKSAKPISWSIEKKLKLFASKKELEIYEPDGWDGYFKQAFYCEACQKMLIDIAAEE